MKLLLSTAPIVDPEKATSPLCSMKHKDRWRAISYNAFFPSWAWIIWTNKLCEVSSHQNIQQLFPESCEFPASLLDTRHVFTNILSGTGYTVGAHWGAEVPWTDVCYPVNRIITEHIYLAAMTELLLHSPLMLQMYPRAHGALQLWRMCWHGSWLPPSGYVQLLW